MKMNWMAIRFTAFIGLSLFFIAPSPAFAQTSVVYHIDDAQVQGLKGLRNIRNHLDMKSNVDYGPLVGALKSRGVRFEVCEITLKNRNLKKEQFTLDAECTPSGVVRIADLQFKNNFAYIRP